MAEDVRAFVCPKCDEPSKSAVLGRTTAYNDDWEIPAEFAFLQCGNCLFPLVQWREDFGQGFGADKPVFMYPAPRRLSHEIPRQLRAEFDEARKCFAAKAYGATVVMVRRTLEGTAQHEGVDKRTLDEALKELQAQGKIDGMLAEWADLLRVVGNDGAHFTGNAVDREDAEDSLDFAEALLDHLYVLRKRFDAFKARRPQKKVGARRAARGGGKT